MSQLTLVRHGQAAFLEDDYDRLSETGREQARLLGAYWVRHATVFDEVYTGPRARHQQTAELAGAAYAGAGLSWPEPVTLAELDEYDLVGFLNNLAGGLASESQEFADLVAGFRRSESERERARSFQKMFEALTLHWVAGGDTLTGLETWPAFRERVGRALARVTGGPGRGRRVAAFTSGGFIGAAVQRALAAPDRAALEINWRVRNGSLTEFVFTPGRLTLDGFNAVPHLEDPGLWTYR